MVSSYRRLRELDFLRGVAILLVLLRHQFLFEITVRFGWIGVDLFYVLSGFLVSGLLFREYKKFGNVKPWLFLIRRGFKIYPVYYLFYIAYLIPIIYKDKLVVYGLVADMLFVQNYVWGWGYAFAHSWSLAVEEHFYIGFALFMAWAVSRPHVLKFVGRKPAPIEVYIVVSMIACLALRFHSNIYFPELGVRNITMTHLRIDSLLAGVLISYWFHFRQEAFSRTFAKNKKLLLFASLVVVVFIPVTELAESFFLKTIGFTILYLAFAAILAWFLTDTKINTHLDNVFTKPLVEGVSRIGFASYSIYIIHGFVNYAYSVINGMTLRIQIDWVSFAVTSVVSILVGIWMTNYIEGFFLRMREKYFPARTS